MPAGLQPDDGVADRKCAEEEHEEEEDKVEVVISRSLEYRLVGNVAGEQRPAAEVHQQTELDGVKGGQTGAEEHAQPDHALVIDQVENVLGDLEVPIAGPLLLQVPADAGAAVAVADDEGAEEVAHQGGGDQHHQVHDGQLDQLLAEHRLPAELPQAVLHRGVQRHQVLVGDLVLGDVLAAQIRLRRQQETLSDHLSGGGNLAGFQPSSRLGGRSFGRLFGAAIVA